MLWKTQITPGSFRGRERGQTDSLRSSGVKHAHDGTINRSIRGDVGKDFYPFRQRLEILSKSMRERRCVLVYRACLGQVFRDLKFMYHKKVMNTHE